MAEDLEYSLTLPFDSDDPEFARGFECGALWHTIEYVAGRHAAEELAGYPDGTHVAEIKSAIHGTSAEMIMRMCDSKGWAFSAEPLDADWLAVTLTPPWVSTDG
jgi:hypothetical protein